MEKKIYTVVSERNKKVFYKLVSKDGRSFVNYWTFIKVAGEDKLVNLKWRAEKPFAALFTEPTEEVKTIKFAILEAGLEDGTTKLWINTLKLNDDVE